MSDTSVLISSYNQRSTIELALEALAHQSILPKEVIVSDDGSTDGTLEWLDALPDDRFPFPLSYVLERHSGYNVVRVYNAGIGRVTGKRILFSNSDVILSPNTVYLHNTLPAHFVGGGEIREIKQQQAATIRLSDVADFGIVETIYSTCASAFGNGIWFPYWPQNNSCGFWCGNMSAPVDWYEKVGGFDSGYNLKYGGEEPDFVERCVAAGAWCGWVHGSVGYHLQHPRKIYSMRQLGIKKYRKEHGFCEPYA